MRSALLDALSQPRSRRVIIIDGGAGAGKSTLATWLHYELSQLTDIQLVRLDQFYPGWDGLEAASNMVVTDVLHPQRPGFWRWDWDANRRSDWVPLDAKQDIIVEGCGALTPATATLASDTIWCELDAESRKARALERDGNGFRPYWNMWAAQEAQHWANNRPQDLADWVVSTQVGPVHQSDPAS